MATPSPAARRALPLRVALACVLALAAFAAPARAQLQWDPLLTGPTPPGPGPSGGTGTWTQLATANWYDSGTNADVPWDGTSVAVFGGTAGTVTISGGVSASGLTFLTDGYTIAASTLTLTGTGTITNATGVNATINAAIAGTTGVVKAGGGTLTLGGVNTFSGGLNVTGGQINFAASTALGGIGAGNVVTLAGGTLNATAALTFTQTILVNTTGTFAANAGVGTVGKVSFSTANQLTGTGTFTKTGTADLQIGAAQSFSGTFVVSGLVEASVAQALGTGSAVTLTRAGELVNGNGVTLPNALTVTADGTGADPILSPITGNTGVYGGSVTLTGPLTVALRDFNTPANGRNYTISGNLAGAGTLTLAGPTAVGGQTLFVTGDSVAGGYTGAIAVPAGLNVAFGTANSLGAAAVTVNSTAAAFGGIGVGYDFATQPTFTNARTGTTVGGVFGVNATLAPTTTVNLATLGGGGMFLGSQGTGSYTAATLGADAGAYRLGGGGGTLTLTATNVLTGAATLTVGDARTNGGGTVVLAAANDYTGATTINGGVLSITNGNALGATAAGTASTTTGYLQISNNVTVNEPLAITAVASGLAASNGLVSLSGNNTYAGQINVNNDATNNARISANAGTLTLSGNVVTANAATSFVVTGAGNVAQTGVISGPAGFITTSTGTVTLSNLNTYTGRTQAQTGRLVATTLNSVAGGTAASSLGHPVTVPLGTIDIGSTTNTGTLVYAGTGETTDRVVNLLGTTGGGTIEQSGTGLLRFTSNFTATGAGIKVLTLQGSTAGTGEIAGAIVNSTATTGVTKTGTGTWTLSGTNTYTGPTTVAQGTLTVTGSLAATTPITFGTNPGGVLNFARVAGSSQTVGALSFAAGSGTVASTYPGTGTTTLTFASVARTAGAVGTLASVGGTNGTTNRVVVTALGTTAGLVNNGVYFNTTTTGLGATYAYNDAAGFVRGIAYGTDATTQTSAGAASISSAAGANVQTTGAVTAQTTDTFTTLNLAGTSATAANNGFTLAASQTLTVGSILKSGGSSATITGGTGLSNASGADYVVRVDAAADVLTVGTAILANGANALVKSGAGTLRLGNAATITNAFTGPINVYGGTLSYTGTGSSADPVSLGAGAKAVTLYNGSVLQVTGAYSNPTAGSKTFVVGAGGATFDAQTGAGLGLDDAGQFSGTGDLTVTGAGTGAVFIGGQAFTYSGNVFVNSGILRLGANAVLGTGTGRTITVNAGGTLDTNNTVTAANVPLGIVLNGGTLSAGTATAQGGAANGSFAQAVTLTANSNVSAGAGLTETVAGNVAGAFALTKLGAGTTVLSGTNTYTGPTTVGAGTLRFANQTALYNNTPASVTNASVVVASGATFALNVGGTGEFTAADVSNLLANSGGFAGGSALGLDTTNAGGTFTTPAVAPANAGVGLTKLGAGTLVLPAGNTYTGVTTVLNGTLQASASGAIAAGNTGGIVITAAANPVGVDFNGFNQTVNTVGGAGTAFTLGGTGAATKPQVLGAGSTVTINGGVTFAAANNPLGGVISVSNLDFGGGTRTFNVGLSTSAGTLANPDLTVSSNLSNGSLTKTGTGVLLLTGNINLTSIVASAGTVGITPATALNATPVTISGAVFDLGGTTQNAGNFTLTSGTIQNGSLTATNFLKQGPGTLTVGVATTVSTVTINQGLANTTSNPATPSTVNENFAAAGAPATNVFSPTATLTLGGPANSVVGGGQLTLTGAAGGTNGQSFASTLIDGGASSAVLTLNATPGTLALNLGTLTRNVGGTFDVTLPAGTQSATNGVVVGNPGTAGTLVTSAAGTAYATVGGNDFAAYSTDSPGNVVGASVAGAGATSIYTAAGSAATFTGNADVTASFTATSGATVNSVRFNAGAFTLTLAGVNTITSGAVLFGSGITAASTVTGGTIVPGAGQELVFVSNKANIINVIGSTIADASVGVPTTVTYRGNPTGTTGGLFNVTANNTYTGPTYITNGRVATQTAGGTNNAPFGTGAGAVVYVDGTQDGQFFTSQNTVIANPFVVVGNGLNENATRSGVIRFGSSNGVNPTLSGSITLVGDATVGNTSAATGAGYGLISGNVLTSAAQNATSFALTKNGTGVIRLTGTNSQTATTVAAGVLVVNADAALGIATAPLTFTASSTLQFLSPTTLQASRPVVLAAGTATIDTSLATAGSTSTVAGVVSGAGALIKTGLNGTTDNPLALTGVNTFTGNVTVSTGSLVVTNSASLGAGTKTVTIVPTANPTSLPGLRLDGTGGNITLPASLSFTTSFDAVNGTPIANAGAVVNVVGNNSILGNFTLTAGGGGTTLLSNAGTLTVAGNVTANTTGRALFLRGDGNGVVGGAISDGVTTQLQVTRQVGTGTWLLGGANTYAGTTNVQAGTVQVGNARGLGYGGVSATAAGTAVTAGATLDLNGTAGINELVTLNGTGVGAAGALVNNAASTTAVIANGVAAGSVTAAGSGYSTPPPAVTVTGGGGTGATAAASLGVTAASFTVAGGTTVYSVAPTVTIGGGNGGATATANLTAGVVTSITVTAAGNNFTAAPTITFTNGTVTTAGTNPTGTGNASNFLVAGVAFTNPGTGYTAAPAVTFGSGAATGTAQLSGVVLASASSVGGVGTVQIDGVVSGGANTLTKVGTGTLTLNAVNTYTGLTTVTGGTLNGRGTVAGPVSVAATGTLTSGLTALTGNALTNPTLTAGGATVTLASGASFGFNIAAAGAADNTGAGLSTSGGNNNTLAVTAGTLSLTSPTVVVTELGGFAGTFNASNTYSWTLATTTGGVTLTGTPTFNVAAAPTLTASGFTLATFGNNLVLNYFQPVPEPATVFGLAAAGLAAAGYVRRRRLAAK